MSDVQLLFLGTGTSAGVPMIGCHCAVCSSSDPHDQRMRPSVLVTYNNTNVLIDTTPELRMQCIAHRIDRVDAVVYTHAHADHVMGLDDVRRFNVLKDGPIDVWADAPTHKILGDCFAYAFAGPNLDQSVFRPHLLAKEISEPFTIAGVTWTPIPLFHGKLPILGFRIGRLAYCTDVSRIPDASFELLHDLDVLVLDALRWKRHTTHFSVDEAVEAARRIGAKQTWFTHISHELAHEETNRRLPVGMQLAFDGLRISARL